MNSRTWTIVRRVVVAVLLMIDAGPAAALTCGPDPVLELFGVMADEKNLSPKAVTTAARIAVDHVIQSSDVIFEGVLIGATCSPLNQRLALVHYEKVLWLRGPKQGQSQDTVVGLAEVWSGCADVGTVKSKKLGLYAGASPKRSGLPATEMQNAEFFVASCQMQIGTLNRIFDGSAENETKLRSLGKPIPVSIINWGILKKELDSRIAGLRSSH
jgi:hypothetical protein